MTSTILLIILSGIVLFFLGSTWGYKKGCVVTMETVTTQLMAAKAFQEQVISNNPPPWSSTELSEEEIEEESKAFQEWSENIIKQYKNRKEEQNEDQDTKE